MRNLACPSCLRNWQGKQEPEVAGRKSGSGRDDNRRESRESFTHGQDDVGKNGVGVLVLLDQGFVRMQSSGDIDTLSTWWLIPLSKWVKTPVINGISRVNPLIIGVITHLLSGMSHQVVGKSMTVVGRFPHFLWPAILLKTCSLKREMVRQATEAPPTNNYQWWLRFQQSAQEKSLSMGITVSKTMP